MYSNHCDETFWTETDDKNKDIERQEADTEDRLKFLAYQLFDLDHKLDKY